MPSRSRKSLASMISVPNRIKKDPGKINKELII